MRPIALLLAASLALNTGCIHTPTVEYKTVGSPNFSALVDHKFGDLETKSIIYLPSKLPLGDFFSRLARGEFSDAFKQLDLNYRESNTNDRALMDVIDEGFIPVYVDIGNQGLSPAEISEKNFALTNGRTQIKAIEAAAVPKEIKRFSPEAMAADVFNVGAVVVGMAALLVALIAIASSCNGCNFSGLQIPSDSGGGSGDSVVINDVVKTTKIDYQSFLLSATILAPGQSIGGILLFHVGRKAGLDGYKLVFLP
jgi:hypothetical protein